MNRNGREKIRTGLGTDAIAEALIDNLHSLQAKLPQHATRNDWYMALAYTVRDRMLDRYIQTIEAITRADASVKAVAYLSAEFLTGPHLGNSLINLGIWQAAQQAEQAAQTPPAAVGVGGATAPAPTPGAPPASPAQ